MQGAARVFSGRDGSGFGHRAPREQDGDDRGREERGDQEDAHDRVCAEALPLLGQPTRIDQLARIAEPTEGESKALIEAEPTQQLRSCGGRNAMYELACVVVDGLGVLLHLVAPLLREAERERRRRGRHDEEGEHFFCGNRVVGSAQQLRGTSGMMAGGLERGRRRRPPQKLLAAPVVNNIALSSLCGLSSRIKSPRAFT